MGKTFSSLKFKLKKFNKVEEISLVETKTTSDDADDKVAFIVELTDEESERLLYFAFRPTFKQLLIRR